MAPNIAWGSNPDSMNNKCLNENCINKNEEYFYWDKNDINIIINDILNYPKLSEPIIKTLSAQTRRKNSPRSRRTRSAPSRFVNHPFQKKLRISPDDIMIRSLTGGMPPSIYPSKNITAFLPDPTKNLKLEREFKIIKNYSQSSNIILNATASDFFENDLSASDTVIFCGHGDILDNNMILSLAFENPNNNQTIPINYSEFINNINKNNNINLVILLACYSSNLFNFIHEKDKNIITNNKEFITCDTLVESFPMRYFLQIFLYNLRSNDVKNSFIKSCNKLKIDLKKYKKNYEKSFGDPANYIMKKIIAPVIGIIRYTSHSETIIYTYTGQIKYDIGYDNIQPQFNEILTTIFPPLPPYYNPSPKAKSISKAKSI